MIRVIFAPKEAGLINAEHVSKAQQEKGLSVPLNLLRSSSQFLKAATKPEWDDLRDDGRTVTPRCDPVLFKTYVHWLHSGTIPRPDDNVPDYKDFVFLSKLYVLGEYLMDVIFKNAIIEAIIAISIKEKYCPIGEAVRIIYEGTSAGSPARRLMTDFCASNANDDPSWTDEFQNCPHEFLVDTMKALVSARPRTSGEYPLDIKYEHYQEPFPTLAP
ncbi:uncharacterized protein CC84DRAFT_1169223 [Paraphaeosphaeria sporulosa]|uniref:BTB domain-containing protein n=1 Tax=Paraphaeosphaeria sporulosa TaxID=1460663 RepID=A0A177BYE7_9PLEO|nr:uncharacterized protein CC84DRAFT_1169223 [Paraphaeosphaeria sporulosa]OAF99708.1 hypothetical protein CC84DRAFT_1169223 [Paraphaeosphaeria sporulosa]